MNRFQHWQDDCLLKHIRCWLFVDKEMQWSEAFCLNAHRAPSHENPRIKKPPNREGPAVCLGRHLTKRWNVC